MKVFMYAVRDKAVEAFMPLFPARARGEAVRMFLNSFDPKSQLGKSPGDYDLYELAIWDDVNGMFEATSDHPRLVMSGLDAAEKVKADTPF